MSSRTIPIAVVLLALFTLAVPLLSTSTLAASHDEVVEVRLVETGDDDAPFVFEPAELTIEPGTTVRWINDEDVFHTVTSTDSNEPGERNPNGVFDQALASEGETFEFTFEEPGTFEYYCKPHSGFMFATITVEGEASSDAPLPGAAYIVGLLGALAVLGRRARSA